MANDCIHLFGNDTSLTITIADNIDYEIKHHMLNLDASFSFPSALESSALKVKFDDMLELWGKSKNPLLERMQNWPMLMSAINTTRVIALDALKEANASTTVENAISRAPTDLNMLIKKINSTSKVISSSYETIQLGIATLSQINCDGEVDMDFRIIWQTPNLCLHCSLFAEGMDICRRTQTPQLTLHSNRWTLQNGLHFI
jgi:hypothetical protein